MTSRSSTAAPLLAVLAVVLATLGAYVGGYFATVEVNDMYYFVDDHGSDSRWDWSYTHAPQYRVGGIVAETFFYPVYLVDVAVRPSVWRD